MPGPVPPMPELPVAENGDPIIREDDIRAPCERTDVLSVMKAATPKFPPQGALDGGVLAADARHDAGGLLRRPFPHGSPKANLES